jgi:ribonuclease HI
MDEEFSEMYRAPNNPQRRKRLPRPEPKVFHVHGEGAGRHGKGSGFAWVKPITGKKQMKWVDGLTKEEAEYKAVIAVLEYVGEGSRVQIRMDSATVSKQITYPLPVRDPRLNALLSEALKLEDEKWLSGVEAMTISRSQNLAAKLFDSAKLARRKVK